MDGQATACWISPLAREANWIASPQQHPGDIIFSSSTGRSFAQATKACICGFCVIVWAPVSIGGLAIRIQDKSIRDHHGPWRGPRAACQPVALPRCSGSSLPRVPLRSASPLRRSPFPVRGHSGRTIRDMPRAQRDGRHQPALV